MIKIVRAWQYNNEQDTVHFMVENYLGETRHCVLKRHQNYGLYDFIMANSRVPLGVS